MIDAPPGYVIYQPVILAVAFFVVQWPFDILLKWLTEFGVSAVVTLALVSLALHMPIARFLLGARARSAAPVSPVPARLAGGERLIAPLARPHHGPPR